ncbi:MAG TPA: S8 family serine peptidase, partial [Arenibaculum sp.]|nr:S8 family serine peptidase [Arenibaculum sp.]
GGAIVGDPDESRAGCGASTRAAGLIGAAVNDAVGIAGVDGSVTLLPIRVLTGCTGSELNLANGIRRAVDEDADIIITPVQFYGGSQALADAVQYAADHDVIMVAPVGYNQGDSVAYPAGFNDCLAVAASDANDAIAAWSNRGPEVAMSAPGTYILMTDLNDGYIELDQAWFAPAAQVAGAAALLRSYAPQLTAVEIANVLMNSAQDLGAPGHDEFFGAGRLNVAEALNMAPLPGLRIEPSGTIPTELPPEAPLSFNVRIVNAGQSLLAGSALLWQRAGGGAFTSKPLVSLGGGNFRADLSAFPCDAEVEFYMTAQGNGGAAVELPRTAPDRVYRAIARDESIIFADDFEADAGWQTAPMGASGSVGAWTRGVPNGSLSGNTPVQTAWDFSPDASTACFFTGQYTPGAGIGTSDVDGGPFILTSPIVAIAAPDVEIRYAAWLYWNGVGVEDVLTAEFSRDGGATWTLADTVQHTSGWIRRAFRLSYFPAVTGNQLQVRFSVSDIPLDSLTEAAIDDVQFAALFCSAI